MGEEEAQPERVRTDRDRVGRKRVEQFKCDVSVIISELVTTVKHSVHFGSSTAALACCNALRVACSPSAGALRVVCTVIWRRRAALDEATVADGRRRAAGDGANGGARADV